MWLYQFKFDKEGPASLPRYGYFLAFVLGAGLYAFVSAPVDLFLKHWMLWILAAVVGCCFLLRHLVKQSYLINYFVLLLAFIVGASISQHQLHSRIQQQLPEAYQGIDLFVDATITGLPRDNGRAWVFDSWVENVHLGSREQGDLLEGIKGKVRLSWYKDKIEPQQLVVGEKWQFQVRLRRPRGLVNPKGFDYHAWLLARAYIATGYIRSHNGPAVEYDGLNLTIFIQRFRQELQQILLRHQGVTIDSLEHEASLQLKKPEVLQALLLGEKSEISQRDWRMLQHTGVVHLLAISGLHIGLVAGLAFFIGRIFARILPGNALLLVLPAMISIAMAGFYAAVAGFSLPTQRALILVVVFNLAHCLGKAINPFEALGFAAVLVLIMDPFALMSPGFWLSFAAVCILIYCFGLHRKRRSQWHSLVTSQLAVLVALTVPLAALGLPTSLAAPLANLVAIPVISFLVVPGLFLAIAAYSVSTSFGDRMLGLCDWALQWLWQYFEFLQRLSLPQLWLAKGQSLLSLIFLGVLGVFLFLSPSGLRVRALGLCLLTLVLSPSKSRQEGLEITVLDVGQGLSVVLRHRGYSVVYDTGDRFSKNFDVGSRILAPFLRSKAIDQLNLLIVSHGDKDHAGGLQGLRQSIDIVERVYGPDLRSQALAEGGVRLCEKGMRWTFADLSLKAIHPDKEYLNSQAGDNNFSCTILVEYQGFSLLLPGDIEKSAEYHLLAAGQLPKVEVMVAPHHGSQTSSSLSFLAKTQPELVVFSAGYGNRYGHPSEKVLDRYRDFGAERLNTAQDGAITVYVAPDASWQVSLQRKEFSRLWFDTQ